MDLDAHSVRWGAAGSRRRSCQRADSQTPPGNGEQRAGLGFLLRVCPRRITNVMCENFLSTRVYRAAFQSPRWVPQVGRAIKALYLLPAGPQAER